MKKLTDDVFFQILPSSSMITLSFSDDEVYKLEFTDFTTVEDYAQYKAYKFDLHSIPKQLLEKAINHQEKSKLELNQWLTIKSVLSASLTLSMIDALTLEEFTYEANSTNEPKLLVNMPEKGNILEVSILIFIDSFDSITFA